MIQLWIDTIPVSWSAAIKGKHCFYDKKYKEKEIARWQLKTQYNGEIITGFVSIEFIFYVPIPKSTSKKGRQMRIEGAILPTTPDTTNMQKLYEDCLQGIVIENDRLSNKITSVRYYSDKPGISIIVRSWEEETKREPEMVPQKGWIKV